MSETANAKRKGNPEKLKKILNTNSRIDVKFVVGMKGRDEKLEEIPDGDSKLKVIIDGKEFEGQTVVVKMGRVLLKDSQIIDEATGLPMEVSNGLTVKAENIRGEKEQAESVDEKAKRLKGSDGTRAMIRRSPSTSATSSERTSKKEENKEAR